MKKLISAGCLFLSLVRFVSAQGTLDAISSYTPGSISGPTAGTAGWTFTPLAGIQVTDLGCLDFMITDQGPITIGFWNSSGTLLVSAVLSNTNELSGETRYAAVTPFYLTAGQTYTLGAYSSSGSITVTYVGQPPLDGAISLAPQFQLGEYATVNGGFTMPNNLGPAGSMCLGPTFRFRDVPEPSALALVAVGVLVLARRRY